MSLTLSTGTILWQLQRREKAACFSLHLFAVIEISENVSFLTLVFGSLVLLFTSKKRCTGLTWACRMCEWGRTGDFPLPWNPLQVKVMDPDPSEAELGSLELGKDYFLRPSWMEPWAIWSCGWHPCPWWGGWNEMIFMVPFTPRHFVIIWSCDITPATLDMKNLRVMMSSQH